MNIIRLGTDEAGRGPLAGNVVSATVFSFSSEHESLLKNFNVTDSKKLTKRKRRKILDTLGFKVESLESNKVIKIKEGLFVVISIGSPRLIEQINILAATLKTMRDSCLLGLSDFKINEFDQIQWNIDGNKSPVTSKNELSMFPKNININPIIKGDSKDIYIGLASIFAKEFRDYEMEIANKKYPQYEFDKHSGYPTKKHLESLKKFGPCEIHRRTFKGVKELI